MFQRRPPAQNTIVPQLHQRQPQRLLHPEIVAQNSAVCRWCRHLVLHHALLSGETLQADGCEEHQHVAEHVEDAAFLASLVVQQVDVLGGVAFAGEMVLVGVVIGVGEGGRRGGGEHQVEAEDGAFDAVLVAFVEVGVFLADDDVAATFYGKTRRLT